MSVHLHPAVERAAAAIADFTLRLAKVGLAMDVVIASEDDNVRPAVETLAEAPMRIVISRSKMRTVRSAAWPRSHFAEGHG
jgi:hypothetical protein